MGDAEFSGRELRFEVGPFGMKTFRVKLARPARALTPAAEAAVELPYNVKTASYNPFRSDANFDGKGCSYAAELLPSCIMYGGVGFEMGDPAAENGVKCRRDTIDLPRGRYGKLYLLAASTMYDTQAVFTSTERSTRHWYPIMAASSDSGAIRGIPSPTSRMRRWPSWARTSMI